LRGYRTFRMLYLFVSQRFIVNWPLNSITVKLDNLLGPYLYQYKKLSLPGIGTFILAENAVLPDETAKVKTAIEGISFQSKSTPQLEDSLIQYIKDNTGKMKALAEADLYSFISTAFEYLNIGKPYYFEGIGTLQKNKDNAYTFTAGTLINQKTEDIPYRPSETRRKSAFDEDAVKGSKINGGKLIIVLGILATLGLVAWGGYYLYNKNTGDTDTVQQEPGVTPPITPDTSARINQAVPDSAGIKPSALQPVTDSTTLLPPSTTAATGTTAYTFIFETTGKKERAAKRYEQLKGISILKEYNNTVAVSTGDSLSFKIYTVVNCTPSDTTRIKEQLNAWYYGTAAMKVKLEH
jgi:hypothetical protein